ncbi:hypothetical protein BH10BDE1_BH10BDE1_03400 [soil metagenome]
MKHEKTVALRPDSAPATLSTVFAAIIISAVLSATFSMTANAAPPARVQTFVRNIDTELRKNPIFHALESLAERHGFEIYFEKETADSLLRVVGADFVQSKHSRPDLDFLGANENIQVAVRGSQYQLDLVQTLITKHLDRINPFTKKSRWQARLEERGEKELGGKYANLVPRVYIACRDCSERVDERLVSFFLDSEADLRGSQNSLELLLKLRELDRAVQKFPTRIRPELFHSALVMLSQMNPYRLTERELPAIYEVMSSINAALNHPVQNTYVLASELQTLGFTAKFQDVSKRILALPEFQYFYDFSAVPELMKKQAGGVTKYLQWTAHRTCEAMFESVRAVP